MSHTPFRIGDHVTGAFFTDRAAEVSRIVRALREPTRLLVFGARRVGKSSAIAVAMERARAEGVLVVRADLSTASSLVDVANRLLHSLSGQRPGDRLAELAAALSPHVTLSFDEASGAPRLAFGVARRREAEEGQRRSLESVIERLAKGVGSGSGESERVAVVLDEFQAIRRLGGESGEWYLRDLIQRHGELSFVCAGSEVTLIHEMLGQDRAFFRAFELLHLGAIDADHLGRWIDDRLTGAGVAAKGVGAAVIAAVGPRTQDVLQVARHVHARGVGAGVVGADDVEEAVLDVVREEDPVIRTTWLNLTAHQQNVLRAVASGVDQLFASATRERFGLSTSSTVATAVDALESRGILFREGEAITFDSPFVRCWVEREALPDVPPH